ncbi:class I SAM-dependent DNA methyltransferase [Nesterenkonia sp. E16_7]|uniref:class I SAM-dependent DNA methyltransferase n=1 Tax=unclassified Nesterenkonia TaxID=2629769 RepID=UPI001A915214|nr:MULTISPECIES: DNA methyltransferase [unclassified Nesterenkonia]MBO0596605.1 class I SAM-dependent DNA methyltransferase [Nesterenkonia sp. E16_10]MBO0598382.1 class I SAM-dependent DNA methyltransferase [Nesterenkonia sp. E16_7]
MSKARSFEEIRNWAAKFAHDWKDIPGDERQWGQQFVRGLLQIYGLTETRAAFYEMRAKRTSTGRQGYIDALVPGKLAIEMKSEGRDLEEAERQALDYLNGLSDAEMPSYILTSDFKTFRLLDIRGGADDVVQWRLEDFKQHADALSFLAGYGERHVSWDERETASIKAAQLMASLYEGLSGSGYDDHQASVFLVRTLFALYADDSGLWERDLFLEFLENRTAEDGGDLGSQMNLLFQVLRTHETKRQTNMTGLLARFPYVNGGLFEERVDIPFFTSDMRTRMIEACYFNWSTISPAIFGSLFQAVKDKKARRSLGEHYTTEANILRVIGPMFLDELEAEFSEKSNQPKALRNLRQRMGRMQFFDPACGCGNFLVIAYRRMRDLELRILERIQKLDRERGRKSTALEDEGLAFLDDQVQIRVRNFHGIEIEDWPARIAATALHLVEHQANQEMAVRLGHAPELLPLDKVETIHTGNALRIDWTQVLEPSADVTIVGNPPFLGHSTRSSEQAQELRDAWSRKDIGRLDYVTGWYKKSIDYFRDISGGRWGFVSTNSVTQGEPVPALFRPVFEAGWRIRFAHRTFAWTSEAPNAASVYCTVVGFDKDTRPAPRLFEYPSVRGEPEEHRASNINGYLVDGPATFVEQRRTVMSPELPAFTFGSMPRGADLIVEPEDYEEVAADPAAAKYLRRFKMGRELIHAEDRWCLWMEDLDPSDLQKSKILRDRIDAVRMFRLNSSADSTRKMADTPHLFGQRSQPGQTYLATPAVFSENRRFATVARLGPEVIAGNKIFKTADPDGFAFAVMSSSMFITWQKTVGGRLKADLNFSNTIVWNNLPLPSMSSDLRQGLIGAGQAVLDARELHPERSLAQHYNPHVMDPALLKAHAKLDTLVDRAFGAKRSCRTEAQRQEVLFSRYAEMTD